MTQKRTRHMRCPNCKSERYQRQNYEDAGGKDGLYFPCTCDDCGCSFVECFRFTFCETNEK